MALSGGVIAPGYMKVVKVNMKKWYVIIVAILVGFILISTSCFAADLRLALESKESDQVVVEESDSNVVSDSSDSKIQTNNDIIIKTEDSESQSYTGNIPPVADFYYEQDQNDKFTFYFYDTSFDPDGEIIYWEWFYVYQGDCETMSYEQNPIYNFKFLSDENEKAIAIILFVEDDGSPQDYDTMVKEIVIPPKKSVSVDAKTQTYIISLYKTFSLFNFKLFNGLKINNFLNLFENFKYYSSTSSMATLCDLQIFDPNIMPNKFKEGDDVTVTFNIKDGENNYEGQFELKLYCEEIGLNIINYPVFNTETHYQISFRWPYGYTNKYTITLKVYPYQIDQWTEINWYDNTYNFNVGPESVSVSINSDYNIYNPVQNSQIASSSSDIIVSGSTYYGSYTL